MNSQVLIDRDLLAEYLSGQGDDWVEAGHKLRELLATPAPIPDHLPGATKMVEAVEVVAWLSPATNEAVIHGASHDALVCARYQLDPLMTVAQHKRIASALQASAKVVPDGWRLVPDHTDADAIVTALYRRFKDWAKQGFGPDDVTWCEVKADILALIAAASPAPGDSQ